MTLQKRISSLIAATALSAAASGAWAIPTSFPFADNVADAGELIIGTVAGIDNRAATVEAGEVDPGVGTPDPSYLQQNGWWSGDLFDIFDQPKGLLDNSMWAWITAPADGLLEVEYLGSYQQERGEDLQFALWSASDPTDFGTFVELAANDDRDEDGLNDDDVWPFITPVAINGSERYYLQVDGVRGESVEYGQVLARFERTGIPPNPAPTPAVLPMMLLGLALIRLSRKRRPA